MTIATRLSASAGSLKSQNEQIANRVTQTARINRARAMLVRHASSDGAIVPSLHSTLTGAASAACFGAGAAVGCGAGAAVCGRRAQPRNPRKISKTRLLRIGVAPAFSDVSGG